MASIGPVRGHRSSHLEDMVPALPPHLSVCTQKRSVTEPADVDVRDATSLARLPTEERATQHASKSSVWVRATVALEEGAAHRRCGTSPLRSLLRAVTAE